MEKPLVEKKHTNIYGQCLSVLWMDERNEALKDYQ